MKNFSPAQQYPRNIQLRNLDDLPVMLPGIPIHVAYLDALHVWNTKLRLFMSVTSRRCNRGCVSSDLPLSPAWAVMRVQRHRKSRLQVTGP